MKWADNCKNDVNSSCDYDTTPATARPRPRLREWDVTECDGATGEFSLPLLASGADGANGSGKERGRRHLKDRLALARTSPSTYYRHEVTVWLLLSCGENVALPMVSLTATPTGPK